MVGFPDLPQAKPLLPHHLTERHTSFKNNCFAEMGSGSEEGSYFRLIDFSITQLMARE